MRLPYLLSLTAESDGLKNFLTENNAAVLYNRQTGAWSCLVKHTRHLHRAQLFIVKLAVMVGPRGRRSVCAKLWSWEIYRLEQQSHSRFLHWSGNVTADTIANSGREIRSFGNNNRRIR